MYKLLVKYRLEITFCLQFPIEERENDEPLDIDAILRGMAAQTAECEDNVIAEDLRGII